MVIGDEEAVLPPLRAVLAWDDPPPETGQFDLYRAVGHVRTTRTLRLGQQTTWATGPRIGPTR